VELEEFSFLINIYIEKQINPARFIQEFAKVMSTKSIKFYRSSEAPYGVFSNFLKYHPIFLKGKFWPSSEHYYQAQKYAGTEYEEAVRLVGTPREAADLGRDTTKPLRPDWEQVKNDIMREAVRAKFSQYKTLQKVLLDTGDAELIEHTTKDTYWADGGDGSGENWLGKILMEIREEFKNELQTATD